MLLRKIKTNKENIIYGVAMALLFGLLQFLKVRFVISSPNIEIYGGLIAFIFAILGGWIVFSFTSGKKSGALQQTAQTSFIFNEYEMQRRKISAREMEVLILIEKGLSNKEIAEQLFVSVNTIKTHTAKLFEKLDAHKRLQAIATAKALNLLS